MGTPLRSGVVVSRQIVWAQSRLLRPHCARRIPRSVLARSFDGQPPIALTKCEIALNERIARCRAGVSSLRVGDVVSALNDGMVEEMQE